MSLEGRALRKGARAGRAKAHFQRDSLGKTGRRLTSDPIRTSLGLLPSGPDPVGEWLVHRQSPGPYLGPKGPESKRGGEASRCENTTRFVMAGLDPDIHVYFPALSEKYVAARVKPGHHGCCLRTHSLQGY